MTARSRVAPAARRRAPPPAAGGGATGPPPGRARRALYIGCVSREIRKEGTHGNGIVDDGTREAYGRADPEGRDGRDEVGAAAAAERDRRGGEGRHRHARRLGGRVQQALGGRGGGP